MVDRIPNGLKSLCIRGLSESMDIRTMTYVIRDIFPNYDIHERTGYPQSMVVPQLDVAGQIVEDVVRSGKYLEFVSLLIRVQDEGRMGRTYNVARFREIVKATYELGFIYDTTNRMFVEDPRFRISRNWGVLEPGKEYTLALLRMDIVGNTGIVRANPVERVNRTYDDLRRIVESATLRRNGRTWMWDGDGGLVAFYLGNKHMNATLSAMEIIHELYLYNLTDCPLKDPLRVRIGVHSGPCAYTESEEDMKKVQTVKEAFGIERNCLPDNVTISSVIKAMLDEIINEQFRPITGGKSARFGYALELE